MEKYNIIYHEKTKEFCEILGHICQRTKFESFSVCDSPLLQRNKLNEDITQRRIILSNAIVVALTHSLINVYRC